MGSTYTPTRNQIIRKNNSFPTEKRRSIPSTLPMASDDRSTSINTAKRSSIISTARTRDANFFCRIPRSVSVFRIMVVLDMEIIPPRNMQLIELSCRILPTPKPAKVIPVIIIKAVITADEPEFISFLKLNSRPRVNMRTTMPRSAQNSMFSRFEIEGRYVNFGLARKPARI